MGKCPIQKKLRWYLLIVVIFLMSYLFNKAAMAEETQSNIVEEKVMVVKDWFQKEWNEIVTFQKANWKQGTEQAVNNIAKFKSFFGVKNEQ
jgi:hypothetical protein